MKPKENPRVSMSIRFEGLTSSEVDALHQVADFTKTKTTACGERVNQPGEGQPILQISKSELKGAGGRYTVIVTVFTELEGWVYPPLSGKDRRWALVQPTRDGLNGLYDALEILPTEETVEDRPIPPGYGGHID